MDGRITGGKWQEWEYMEKKQHKNKRWYNKEIVMKFFLNQNNNNKKVEGFFFAHIIIGGMCKT